MNAPAPAPDVGRCSARGPRSRNEDAVGVLARGIAVAEPPLHPRAATGLAAARVHGGIGYALAVGDCRVCVLREGPP